MRTKDHKRVEKTVYVETQTLPGIAPAPPLWGWRETLCDPVGAALRSAAGTDSAESGTSSDFYFVVTDRDPYRTLASVAVVVQPIENRRLAGTG